MLVSQFALYLYYPAPLFSKPLYAEMQRIIPGIEFVKGIAANIEDEHFLNPAIRNLIVIDDLSEASNDKRICDLFTKGSHHRNLKVICLVQNLYYQGKERCTMSLNSQYLVLFNSPLDQQQITVSARQMYPGQSEKFLNTYRMATYKPFGYLLIDLKTDTGLMCFSRPISYHSRSAIFLLFRAEGRWLRKTNRGRVEKSFQFHGSEKQTEVESRSLFNFMVQKNKQR